MGEPTEKDLVDESTEAEDDRIAADEAADVDAEDDAAAKDARTGRVPG